MRILAIDPGYERVGAAVMEKNLRGKERLLYSSCFKTNAKDRHADRLFAIGREIERLISEFAPKALVIEELFLNTNQKTAMKVAEARGAIIFEAARRGLNVLGFSPLEIKVAVTGYGRSDKRQVISMIPRLVKLPDGHKPQDDEYDAIAAGLTFFAVYGAMGNL